MAVKIVPRGRTVNRGTGRVPRSITLEPVLDILRRLRGLMNDVSTLAVGGVHLDWLFHLLGGALLVLLMARRWDHRRAVRWTAGLILAKELFDLFAKTRLEYIRPPTLDLLSDVTAGVTGMVLGVLLARRLGWPPRHRSSRRRSHRRGHRRRHHRSLFERCLACRAAALMGAAVLLFSLLVGILSPASAGARPGLAVAAVLALALFAWPRARTWLWWVLPLGPVLDWPLLTPGRGIYTVELVGGAGIFWWLAHLAAGRRRAVPSPGTPLALWSAFAAAALAALVVGHPALLTTFAGWRAIRALLLAGLLGWTLRDTLAGAASRRRLLAGWSWALLAALLLLAAGGLGEAAATHLADEPGSFFRGSVSLAVFLAWSLPPALLLVLADPDRRRRRLAVLAVAAGLLCLPLTASRGAMGSVLVTTAILAVRTARYGTRRVRLGIACGVLAAAGGMGLLAAHPEVAGESFAYKWRATMTGDLFSTRRDAWREAREAIRSHPITGEGPGAWAPAIPLELARRHGLPAMLLALAALLTAAGEGVQRSWRRREENGVESLAHLVSLGAGLGLVGLLLVGLAETGLGARAMPLVVTLLVLVDAGAAAAESGGTRQATDRIIAHARRPTGEPAPRTPL